MDEKVYSYLIKNSLAIGACTDGVNVALEALKKQHKINKSLKFRNNVLLVLVAMCVSNISTLIKRTEAQHNRIKALEEKVYAPAEEVKAEGKKGE